MCHSPHVDDKNQSARNPPLVKKKKNLYTLAINNFTFNIMYESPL